MCKNQYISFDISDKVWELSRAKSSRQFINLVFGSLTPIVSRETHLTFKCTCNHEKIVNIVKNFDSQNPDKEIVVICEYCNKKYAIDKNEIDS